MSEALLLSRSDNIIIHFGPFLKGNNFSTLLCIHNNILRLLLLTNEKLQQIYEAFRKVFSNLNPSSLQLNDTTTNP